jgi:hypothetical protein
MKKLLLLFAALLVAGCGEKSSSEGSESASEKPTGEPSADAVKPSPAEPPVAESPSEESSDSSETAEQFAKKYLEALAKKDADAAWSMMTSSAQATANSIAALTETTGKELLVHDTSTIQVELSKLELVPVAGTGDYKMLTGSSDGEVLERFVTKVDGNWKIDWRSKE